MEDSKSSNTWKIIILLINCLILAIGSCGGPIIMRLYFIQGGTRIWFPSWLQTAGWPIILIPILISYFYRRRKAASAAASDDGLAKTKLILMNHRVFIATAVIGLLTGLDDYLYAYGLAKLPVSTSSLIIASQLAFTALFAFLIVKQKFTAYSINAVVLLTVGTGILALNGSGDRPQGESSKMYVLGFILTLGAAALYGLILPMIEKMYLKAKQAITYTLVLEIQLVMCFFATLVCTVGMVVNKDFQAIPREAREFDLGETKYYLIVVWCAVIFQCFFLGAIGVIFCASSLFSGIMIAVLLPVTEILAVICFNEKFQAAKGVSLALSLWGFVSYFYGEIKQRKKETLIQVRRDESQDTQMMPVASP